MAVARTVLLAGATGLVGRELLDLLSRDDAFARVTAIVRRPLAPAPAAGRVAAPVVDFDQLERHADLFAVEQVFCALGTTAGAAGARAAFRRVDLEYPLRIAQLARERGARHYLLVSALGANPRSGIFYYQMKGEVEETIGALGFRSFTIARPSILLGERAEFRPGEQVAKALAFLVPSRFKPVHVRQVAAALVQAAREDAPGQRVLTNAELRAITVAAR